MQDTIHRFLVSLAQVPPSIFPKKNIFDTMDGGSAEVAGDFVAGFSKWFAETGAACNLEEYGRALPADASTLISSTTSLSSQSMTH